MINDTSRCFLRLHLHARSRHIHECFASLWHLSRTCPALFLLLFLSLPLLALDQLALELLRANEVGLGPLREIARVNHPIRSPSAFRPLTIEGEREEESVPRGLREPRFTDGPYPFLFCFHPFPSARFSYSFFFSLFFTSFPRPFPSAFFSPVLSFFSPLANFVFRLLFV